MSLGLLLILVWLNDNPLFGGQVETTLARPARRDAGCDLADRSAEQPPRPSR